MGKKNSYAKWGYIFSIPFVITFLIFSLYPILYTIFIGFTDLSGVFADEVHLLEDPLKNFKDVLSNPTFITALKNTVIIWIANFIPQILLALLLAAWFTSTRGKIKCEGFFKVVFYMPNIITAATIAILFKALFDYPMSPVNDILVSVNALFGRTVEPYNFLIKKNISKAIVAFIQFWMWYGYTMIILISGILGISPEIFEAAEVDGANGWQTFFMITLPNIKTILLFTLVTSIIGGLNMFDIPKLFMLGGPDNATTTTNVFIYNLAFSGKYLYNKAAAASMIMFVIIAILSAIMFYLLRDEEEEKAYKLEKARVKAYKAEQKAKKRGKEV